MVESCDALWDNQALQHSQLTLVHKISDAYLLDYLNRPKQAEFTGKQFATLITQMAKAQQAKAHLYDHMTLVKMEGILLKE